MQPRLRDLGYPAVYLLSFALLFGCAYFYLDSDAAVPRLRPAAAAAADGPTEAGASSTARLEVERTTYFPGTPDSVQVRVFGTDGRPVSATADRTLFLSVVRRDLAEFQPLRAVADGSGRWSAPLTLHSPGPYRLLAEVWANGEPLMLTADLTAPGEYSPAEVRGPILRSVSWPYAVRMEGAAQAGRPSRLRFTVLAGTSPARGLDRGDLGRPHLTALRLGDLAPARVAVAPDRPGAAAALLVDLACSRPGTYRLFLTFGDARAPHVTDFTLPIPA